jgi:hypothetical protein
MVMANIIALAALYQTGKRQEYAEAVGDTMGGSKHPHLLPKTPQLFAIHNQFGQVINREWIDGKSDPISSIEEGNRLIAAMATKTKIPNLDKQWRVVPILVCRANTIFSPLWDTTGAESELFRIHNMPGQEQMKNMDAVYNYRKFLHTQAKFGNPTELLENVMDDGVTSMGMNGNGDDDGQ